MINTKVHLVKDLFSEKIEQVPTRNGYGEGLVEAGKKNKQVVALCADLTDSTRTAYFKEKFPERFIEIGVAEQLLATAASGMANYGKIPFISSYAAFSPGRNWEQIRTTIALKNNDFGLALNTLGPSFIDIYPEAQALRDSIVDLKWLVERVAVQTQ